MKKALIIGSIITSLFVTQKAFAAEYTVQPGDTLWKISTANQISVTDLKSINHLTSNTIYVGQVLSVSTSTDTTSTYTIQSGDYLSLIAKKYGITSTQLIALNPQITNPNLLYVGQVINVPTATTPQTTISNWQTVADNVVKTGEKYLGTPYQYGAAPYQTSTFDCSSFTQYVYGQNGITLPRVSRDQANVGTTIPYSQAREGDLLFFDTNGDGVIDHVSIYVNANSILHAATSKGVSLADPSLYWGKYLVKTVRVIN